MSGRTQRAEPLAVVALGPERLPAVFAAASCRTVALDLRLHHPVLYRAQQALAFGEGEAHLLKGERLFPHERQQGLFDALSRLRLRHEDCRPAPKSGRHLASRPRSAARRARSVLTPGGAHRPSPMGSCGSRHAPAAIHPHCSRSVRRASSHARASLAVAKRCDRRISPLRRSVASAPR